MTTKKWLLRARLLDQNINALQLALEQELALLELCTEERSERAAKLARLMNTINKQIDLLIDTRAEIVAAVGRIEDPTLRTLLLLRYVNGQSWARIAEALCYSDFWTRSELHDRALRAAEAVRSTDIRHGASYTSNSAQASFEEKGA